MGISKNRKIKQTSFGLSHKNGRFKIISLNNSSILTYLDMKTNETCHQTLLQVAQDAFVINNIDPTQACYIGMQFGYQQMIKTPSTVLAEKNQRPTLKLIK